MPSADNLDIAELRALQQKIINCYNKQRGEGVKPLMRAFRTHPANYSDTWIARNLAYIAKQIKHIPTKLEIFEQVLKLEPDNVFYLTSYANTLIRAKKLDQALPIFEKIIRDNPRDFNALTAYGNALVRKGEITQALDKFSQALVLKPKDTTTLTSYANALAEYGNFKEAFELFERSLQIEQDNTTTLTSYANALFLAATTLQHLKKPAEAVEKLEKIKLYKLPPRFADFLRLNMGRLYFQLGREIDGQRMFEYIIKNAKNTDATRLKIAMNLLVVKPYSDEANRLLKEIAKTSPNYKQAQRMLSLNLDSKQYHEKFSKDVNIQDKTQINRILYHKIKSRIAVLKENLYEIVLDNDDSVLHDLLNKIDEIFVGIKQRCEAETKQTEQLDKTDYIALLDVISTTANDIIDFVGNKISNLREELWDYIHDLADNNPRQTLYDDISQHLQRTVVALNDVKAVNRGIQLKWSNTNIQNLFVNWLNISSLRNACIQVHLTEPQHRLFTDIQKIHSFLDELVENSLKHNPQQNNLHINLKGTIKTGLLLRRDDLIVQSSEQKQYLYLCVSDNGKGIPEEKKEWIFQPLTTTAPNNEGSGLGLFGIRRTVIEMQGLIEETGNTGACFEIYLPLEET